MGFNSGFKGLTQVRAMENTEVKKAQHIKKRVQHTAQK